MEVHITWNLCRICRGDVSAKDVEANNGKNIFEGKLASKLMLITGIKMDPKEDLPKIICKSCNENLEVACKLRAMCQSSDKYFRELVIKTTTPMLNLTKQKAHIDRKKNNKTESCTNISNPAAKTSSNVVKKKADLTSLISESYMEELENAGECEVDELFVFYAGPDDVPVVNEKSADEYNDENVSDSEQNNDYTEAKQSSLSNLVDFERVSINGNEDEALAADDVVLISDGEGNANNNCFYEDQEHKKVHSIEEELVEAVEEETELEENLLCEMSDFVQDTRNMSECDNDDDYDDDNNGVDDDNAVGDDDGDDDDEEFVQNERGNKRDHQQSESVGSMEETFKQEFESCDSSQFKQNAGIKRRRFKSKNSSDDSLMSLPMKLMVSTMKMPTTETQVAISSITLKNSAEGSKAAEDEDENIECDYDEIFETLEKTSENEPTKIRIIKKEVDEDSRRRDLLPCEYCGNLYETKSALTYHMRIHEKQKRLECEICGKRFNASCNLTAHMRTHTGEKPYQCEYCPRRFADRSTQIKHERIHTNEKPFACDVCHRSFSLSTSLKAHQKIHTGVKDHKCIPCGKAFTLPHQLKTHYNTATHKAVIGEMELEWKTCEDSN